MTTAQTVQLLDANNNNISPAVCIDSIYYEGTVGSNPYRFALREKFIVGSNLDNPIIDLKPDIPVSTEQNIYVPYIFSEKNNNATSVWKLSAGAYDIAPDVSRYIIATFKNEYATKKDVSSNFLDLSGHNIMTGDISMGSRMRISSTGLSDVVGNNSLTLEDTGVNLTSSHKTTISATSVYISGTAEVSIGSTDAGSNTHIHGYDMLLQSQIDVSIGAGQSLSLLADNRNITIDTLNGNIVLNSSHGNANNNIQFIAKNIKFNDATFIPPTSTDSQKHRILSVSDGGVSGGAITMSWDEMGGMKLLNFGQEGETGEFEFVETAEHNKLSGACVSFSGGHKHTTIGPEGVSDIKVATIGGCTLDGSDILDIKVMSINNKAVVSTTAIEPLSVVETDTFNTFKNTVVHYNKTNVDNTKILLLNKDPESNEFFITQTNDIKVDASNGKLIAKAFVMSSDRNMKTDIREDCFAKEMPSLHGFKWKDTSVQSYGFIAQELEEEGFGHLVTEHDGIKGVDYMAALSYKVAQLEHENKMLQRSLFDLYDKLNIK